MHGVTSICTRDNYPDPARVFTIPPTPAPVIPANQNITAQLDRNSAGTGGQQAGATIFFLVATVKKTFGSDVISRNFIQHCTMTSHPPLPFWKTTPLKDMTNAQWESLCDGCGRCCLHKLRDDETDELYYTSVACRLLDVKTCQCTDYPKRHRKVQDCVTLTPTMIPELDWLPPDCAYKRLSDGDDLPPWHPLITGSPQTVITSGASAAGRCISERRAGALEDYVVDWPAEHAKPTEGN